RVRTRKDAEAEPAQPAAETELRPRGKAEKPVREAKVKAKAKPEPVAPDIAPPLPEVEATQPGFLARNRRPLLLAATLVAVSMLALNLVMQRMAPPAPATSAAAVSNETGNPPASDDQSSIVPPRVIDMVDVTATGSINPGEP